MLIKKKEAENLGLNFPIKGLSRKYMKEHDIIPGDSFKFEFGHTITAGNYIVVCEAFMFGYGSDNNDHHVKTLKLDLHSEIIGQNSIEVTALCEMCDSSGHLMTLQGRDNSYVRVGVIALPKDIVHGPDDEIVSGMSCFDITYTDDDDHHLQEVYVVTPERKTKNFEEGAYMQDDSDNKSQGKVFSKKLGIPQSLLQNVNPTEDMNLFTALQGFRIRNDKGDTHVRQVGIDGTKYDSKYGYHVLKDKHGNHAKSDSNFLMHKSLVFAD